MTDVDFFKETATEQGGLSVATLDEPPELSELEVEEMFYKVRALNNLIANEQKRRDAFQNHYREKIAKAEEIFEADTRYYRAELDALNATLRRFAEKNITGKKRSMKFPSGTLRFTKQQPNFFIDGVAVSNDNPKLIELARNLDADLIATKEIARWGELKKRLETDGDTVYLRDTGEVIPELRAWTEPDKFSVETA